MAKASALRFCLRLALIAAIALAPAAYAAPQDSPVGDSGGNTVCANLGVYNRDREHPRDVSSCAVVRLPVRCRNFEEVLAMSVIEIFRQPNLHWRFDV